MNFKKTLILSMSFHICFLAVVFLLMSVNLFGNRNQEEEILFVKLIEDADKPGNGELSVKEKKSEAVKSGHIHIGKLPAVSIQQAKTEVTAGGDESNIKKETDNGIVLTDYKSRGEEGGAGTSDNSKTTSILPDGIFELIRDAIEKAKIYPVSARRMGMEGTVHISFRISPQGEPQNMRIIKSSGFRILDTATVDIVKKAAPFPGIDAPVEVPVVFKLD
jgi:TonB family protein